MSVKRINKNRYRNNAALSKVVYPEHVSSTENRSVDSDEYSFESVSQRLNINRTSSPTASQQKADSEPPSHNPSATILVSAVLSIHNRSRLFKRALDGYLWQTMPPDWWEIILIDDMSTEDLSKTYEHLIGKINLRHVKIDHTRHPFWKKMNPRWKRGYPENWYHTPAITINVGCLLAAGPVICLCHPEILHAPTNFEIAVKRLGRERIYLFGKSYLGSLEINKHLDGNPDWTASGWDGFLSRTRSQELEYYGNECYWYTSFISNKAVSTVRGVDFNYLNGVAGEDDDFRERVRRAGWPPVYDPDIQGFHQNHSDEKEKHRRRDTEEWAVGLESNRKLYESRKENGFPIQANEGMDWGAKKCIVSETRFLVGEKDPR